MCTDRHIYKINSNIGKATSGFHYFVAYISDLTMCTDRHMYKIYSKIEKATSGFH